MHVFMHVCMDMYHVYICIYCKRCNFRSTLVCKREGKKEGQSGGEREGIATERAAVLTRVAHTSFDSVRFCAAELTVRRAQSSTSKS